MSARAKTCVLARIFSAHRLRFLELRRTVNFRSKVRFLAHAPASSNSARLKPADQAPPAPSGGGGGEGAGDEDGEAAAQAAGSGLRAQRRRVIRPAPSAAMARPKTRRR